MTRYYNEPLVEVPQNKSVTCYSKDITLIQFIMAEFGNFKFMIDVSHSVIDLCLRFIKKKRLRTIMTGLKYGVAAGALSSELVMKMNKYRSIKKGENTVVNVRDEKILRIIGEKSGTELIIEDFTLGKGVNHWIFNKPRTKTFKVLGFYEFENMEAVMDIWKIKSGNLFILLEYKDRKFVWNLSFSEFNGDILLHCSSVHCNKNDFMLCSELKGVIFKEFINSFDISKNVIYVKSGLSTRERQTFDYDIDQINIDKLCKEIVKVLKRGKKRGYGFVGLPGTGKSTIIRKIESLIKTYPIVYLNTVCFDSPYRVAETFMTIRHIQPCICIFEDLDSFGFKKKNDELGAFLEGIDDIDDTLNCVFIATINDTNLVHYSLINRPGRFDQIKMINTPRTIKEVYNVMHHKYGKILKEGYVTKEFFQNGDMDEELLKQILEKRYTQADICEIVEKAVYIDQDLALDNMWEAVKELEESKKALKECNFNDTDPFSYEDKPQMVTAGRAYAAR